MQSTQMYSDKFKINWTERNRGLLTTSVTGFEYQVSAWKKDYFNKYNINDFKTKVITKIENEDGTITIAVSRTLK